MTNQIEKIKKEVWEELRDYDVDRAIELTFRKTAQAIFRDLEKHETYDIIDGKKTGDIVLLKDEFKKLKKKWGAEL